MLVSTLIDLALSVFRLASLDEPDPGEDPGRGQKPIGG
jgi:hypothetical protein